MDDKLKFWLTALLQGLVVKPEEVIVEKSADEMGVLFTIRVANEDAGKIIGKGGVCASAIRTLLRSAGYIQNARVSLKIDVPQVKENDLGNNYGL